MLSDGRSKHPPYPLALFLAGVVVLAFVGGWVVAVSVARWLF
jgi:hypothetical protein